MKTSTIFFIISGLLAIITISPYTPLFAMVGLDNNGIFISGISEGNAILIFLTLASAIIGVYLRNKRK